MTDTQEPRLPEEPTPEEPTPVEPTPVDPTPVDPTPVEPTPVEPTPEEPTPVDPTPVEPTPVDPTPVDPTPADPTPADPPSLGSGALGEPTAYQNAGQAPEPTPEPTAVDSFAAEPAAVPPADPTPEVPATLADEPPAEPAAVPPLAPGTPEPVQPYEHAAEPATPAPVEPTPTEPTPTEPTPTEPTPTEPTHVEPAADEHAGEAETSAAPDEAAAPAEAAAQRRGRSWLPVTAVGLTVALLAGATGFLAWQLRQQSLAADARPDAIAAARDAARLLFSYNHQTLEDDFAKGLAVTTGEFREEYSRTTTEVVTPVAEQYDAVVVAEVVEASIIDADAGKVTVLVFLNQGTTSTRVQGQQVDQSRVRMHLVERDGDWLVEAVEAL